MDESTVLMGRFAEVDDAADAIEQLRELGVSDADVEVISGYPYSAEILGRPHTKSVIPLSLISLGSAAAGFLIGLFFTVISPNLYVNRVGGQPVVPIPPTILLQFEFTMIFLILGTFLGFLWLNLFPTFSPSHYDPKVSDGEIALIIQCAADLREDIESLLTERKAENVHEAERRIL
jgi:hypothetical protein